MSEVRILAGPSRGFRKAAARDIAAMTTRESRLERNQDTFRGADERLGDLVGEWVGSEQTIPFLCECPDDECLDAVSVTLQEYERSIRISSDSPS
jgi:hypothetical protein